MENKQLAQGIASLGRYGDTTLMHMRPEEVNQLTAISRANGGDITINPDTGMPEAFLGNFISALLPTAAGLAAGAAFPMAPILAPALAGGTTAFLQGKRDPLSIGMGALSGYGGAQLGSTLSGFGATKAAVPELAGTAEIAGGSGGTPVADAALTGQTIGSNRRDYSRSKRFWSRTIYKSIQYCRTTNIRWIWNSVSYRSFKSNLTCNNRSYLCWTNRYGSDTTNSSNTRI
jgi:hypothetical protein